MRIGTPLPPSSPPHTHSEPLVEGSFGGAPMLMTPTPPTPDGFLRDPVWSLQGARGGASSAAASGCGSELQSTKTILEGLLACLPPTPPTHAALPFTAPEPGHLTTATWRELRVREGLRAEELGDVARRALADDARRVENTPVSPALAPLVRDLAEKTPLLFPTLRARSGAGTGPEQVILPPPTLTLIERLLAGGGDIETIAFLVMMAAEEGENEDIADLLRAMKETNNRKELLRKRMASLRAERAAAQSNGAERELPATPGQVATGTQEPIPPNFPPNTPEREPTFPRRVDPTSKLVLPQRPALPTQARHEKIAPPGSISPEQSADNRERVQTVLTDLAVLHTILPTCPSEPPSLRAHLEQLRVALRVELQGFCETPGRLLAEDADRLRRWQLGLVVEGTSTPSASKAVASVLAGICDYLARGRVQDGFVLNTPPGVPHVAPFPTGAVWAAIVAGYPRPPEPRPFEHPSPAQRANRLIKDWLSAPFVVGFDALGTEIRVPDGYELATTEPLSDGSLTTSVEPAAHDRPVTTSASMLESGEQQQVFARATTVVTIRRTTEEIDAEIENVRDELDSQSELSSEDSLRLQARMDRRAKLLEALSNLLKKSAETKGQIVGNMK